MVIAGLRLDTGYGYGASGPQWLTRSRPAMPENDSTQDGASSRETHHLPTRDLDVSTLTRRRDEVSLRSTQPAGLKIFPSPSWRLDICGSIALAHPKATQMALPAPSPTRVRFAGVVLSATVLLAVCAFHAAVHAASPVTDGVSLRESTIT